jgi:mannose-6-phosphate isomerase-like protein (cupin superfamily)
MFGGVAVEIAGGQISDKVGKAVAEDHRHPMPEIYFVVSPNRGGAVIQIRVNGRRFELASPGLLYVPAGALHHFLTLRAELGSFCFGILLVESP